EAVSEGAGPESWASVAHPGPVPHHDAPQSGGGPSAAGREYAAQRPALGRAAQEDALEIIAQGQPRPGPGQGEIGGAVGQPTGHGPGVGFEGGIPAFLEVSLSDLG